MPSTPRMGFVFPSENQDPYYDGLVEFYSQIDAAAYAAREDRSIILHGGGTVTFDAGTGTLAWSSDIDLFSPITGFAWRIAAGTLTLEDGQLCYVNITRAPSRVLNVELLRGTQIPSSNQGLIIGIRRGTAVYFRNGAGVLDGSPLTDLGLGGGGGGGGGGGTSQQTVTQVGHGFTLTNQIPIPVCWDPGGSEWVLADQVPSHRTKQAFIVDVLSANSFTVQLHGYHSLTPGHGLTDGDYYWLDTVAPYYTDTPSPTGTVQTLWVVEGDRLQLLNQAAYEISEGSGGTSQRTVTQVGHGFTIPDLIPLPLYWDAAGSEWVIADQVPPERTKQAYLVEVIDANTFVVQLHGYHSLTPGHGMLDGEYYWLDTSAPFYTPVQPVSGIAQCLWVVEGDRLQLLNQAPYNAAAAAGGGKQTSKYIVGNALTGDTLAICDFLDPGDGTGFAAAMAAANADGGGDIWVRGGVYDFSTISSPALPILMSTTTTIQGTPTNQLIANFFGSVPAQQTLFIIGDSREFIGIAALPPPDFGIVDITDIVFQVNPVDVAASGTTLILCYGRVTRCSFLLPATPDITETLQLLVAAGAIDECRFTGNYANGDAGGVELVAFSSEIVTNCAGEGVDTPAIIGTLVGQSPRMEGCYFATNPNGVVVQSGISFFTISNCALSAAVGFSLVVEGSNGKITNCIIDSVTIAGSENQISNSRVTDLTILVGATDTHVIGVFPDSYTDLGIGTVIASGGVGRTLSMGAGKTDSGNGGSVFLNGGDAVTTGNGGDVFIAAGNADTGNGGVLQLESGKASNDGSGGDIYILVGDSIGANAGGILTITAGVGAPGGNLALAGGAGVDSGDSGGDVTITGGAANAAGAGVGGDINITGGTAGPTGTAGSLALDSGDLNGSSNGSTITIGGTNATVVNIGNGDNSTTAIALRGLTTVRADEVTTGGTISARHLVLSSPDAAGVPDVSIYTSDVNPNGNLTALQGSLAISPAGLFRNTNGGTAWAIVHAGIDYVEGFVADAGTAANRRGYTRGSDPLSATPSFTGVVVGRITNTTFVSGGSRQLFGTRSAAGAAGGGWCIYNEGDTIGFRFTDNGGTQRSATLLQSTTAWRVLHITVAASGADLTIRLFVDGAQISEVYDGAAGGQYTVGAEMCVGVLDEGAILPAALHNRIHGAGYATAAMTPAEVGAHADAIIAAGQLVQTPSGTALADGWRADVALGTPAAATWASFLGGTSLTTLNTTALTLASQSGPLRWV